MQQEKNLIGICCRNRNEKANKYLFGPSNKFTYSHQKTNIHTQTRTFYTISIYKKKYSFFSLSIRRGLVSFTTCGIGGAASSLSQNMFFTGTNSTMIPLNSDALTMGVSNVQSAVRTPPTLWQYPSKYSFLANLARQRANIASLIWLISARGVCFFDHASSVLWVVRWQRPCLQSQSPPLCLH